MKLIITLNGNFLCPFQAFVDLAEQLSPASPLPKMVFTPVCELVTINDWINLESLGQPAAIRAQALSFKLHALLKARDVQNLELHVHTAQGTLSSDNLYFFLFLNRLVNTQFVFYVDAEQLPRLQQTLATVDEEQWHVDYRTECADTQKSTTGQHPLLKEIGFDFHFGNALTLSDAEVQILVGYVWLCLKAGAPEAGSKPLARILTELTLSTSQWETLFMHLTLTRFLAHQYAQVTAEEFPPEFISLSQSDVTSLHFIKAYSATLTRELLIAEQHFKACHVHEDMTLGDENSLYRLNLYALFLVLQGKEDTALQLEMRIKAFIEKNQVAIAGLKYVNFINIARLHKKAKQFDQALSYYGLAYEEISGGGYTLYDQIYYNMNIGAVHEAAGRYERALYFWMNASLYWLACNNPYGLSWRPRLILCQEKITDILKPLSVAGVDAFLHQKLNHLLTQCGMTLNADPDVDYDFTTEKAPVEACYIHHNLILYGVSASVATPLPLSTKRQLLKTLVSAFLKQTIAIPPNHTTLLVDTAQEGLYPSLGEQAYLMAALKNCDHCYYNGHRLSFSQEKKQALLNEVQVFLTPAITTIEAQEKTLSLKYSRSFLNKTLTDTAEIDLVKRLQQQKMLCYHQLNADERKTLSNLIEKKVAVAHDTLLLRQFAAATTIPC